VETKTVGLFRGINRHSCRRIRSMTEEFDIGTPTGKLMLTMLSGFAAHERDSIRERSVAGTNRKVEAAPCYQDFSWSGMPASAVPAVPCSHQTLPPCRILPLPQPQMGCRSGNFFPSQSPHHVGHHFPGERLLHEFEPVIRAEVTGNEDDDGRRRQLPGRRSES
jgi:hypothetical protein